MDELSQTPELYHPDILAYARDPARWRKEHDAKYVIKAYNPVCGDKYVIRLDADGVITDTSFFGYGCVVSKASIELLCEMITGMDFNAAGLMMHDCLGVLNANEPNRIIDLRLAPFMLAQKFPGRMQCVMLGWEALLRSDLFRNN